MINSLDNLADAINLNKSSPFINNINIVQQYSGDDWKKYINHNIINTPFPSYFKKKVDIPYDWFEFYIISWGPHSKTFIHDHAINGCILKLLDGLLIENIYSSIDDDSSLINTKNITNNMTGFMTNDIGFHSIQNNNNNISVSLHIYSPINHKTRYNYLKNVNY